MHPVNTAASTRGRSVTAGSLCPALCSPQDDSLLETCRSEHPVLLAWTGNPSVINWPFLNGCVIACLTVCLCGNVTVCLAVRTTVHLITCFSPLLPVDFINSTWCFKGATSKIFYKSPAQNPHLQRVDSVWRSIPETKQLLHQLLRFLAAKSHSVLEETLNYLIPLQL